MASRFFRCSRCGNIVGLINEGKGTMMCCGEAMEELTANTTDAAQEKHVPVVEFEAGTGTLKVAVGSVAHPMAEDHYVEWIELTADGETHFKFLNPGDAPVAEFDVRAESVTAREFCNKHGLWKAQA